MRRSFVTGAGIILVLAQIGWADLPATISYQGVLKDNNGQIVADGPYSLTFAITDTLGNKQGTPTPWSETHNVTTAEGIFEVILGSITPFANYAIRFNYPYWLEITVDGSVLSPRTKLNAVPYAFRAEGIRSDVTAFHPGWKVVQPSCSPKKSPDPAAST